jgi:filamentous hemagglutinin
MPKIDEYLCTRQRLNTMTIYEAGISQATRAWDKHAGRPGGTFEPLPGTTAEKDAVVSNWINEVLTNPQTTRTQLSRGGVEYRLPNGQGVVFEPGGKVNLLDPRWKK